MSEIKFDHFKNIEELIQHLEMWYAEDDYFEYDRYFHLDDARKMGMYIYKQSQEIERLNNIIKEVREYIQDRYDGEVLTHTFDKDNVKELLAILNKGE